MAEPERLYVWEARPHNGLWYTIGALVPGLGLGASPLMVRKEELARQVEGLARAHGAAKGEDVRLAVYERVDAFP